jgi:L,D-transpeptidase-like protein
LFAALAGAGLAKLAYAAGLKSAGIFPIVGSTPTPCTSNIFFDDVGFSRVLTTMRAGHCLGTLRRISPILILCLGAAVSVHCQTTSASVAKADRIVIVKSTRTMTLMNSGQVLKTYKVALSAHSIGGKERVGDDKTPEGLYTVDWKNAQSKFHLALHVSYPNAADRERARKLGVDPGGEIEIHGLGASFGWLGSLHRQTDWTAGCIAVTNEEIDEIWKLVAVGTPIEIKP